MEWIDQLRAAQRAREALQRGLQADRALPRAARGRRLAREAQARGRGRRQGGPLREDRQGLRVRAGPVRGPQPRRALRARAAALTRDRDPGLRRPRRHRPHLLRAALLPRSRQGRRPRLRAAGPGDEGRPQGRHRPLRAPQQGAPGRDPPDGRRPHPDDYALPRRGHLPRRPRRRGLRGGEAEEAREARAGDGQAADRVPDQRLQTRQLPRRVPRGAARPARAEGGRQGGRQRPERGARSRPRRPT